MQHTKGNIVIRKEELWILIVSSEKIQMLINPLVFYQSGCNRMEFEIEQFLRMISPPFLHIYMHFSNEL